MSLIPPEDLGRLRRAMFLGLRRDPLSLPDPLGPLVQSASPPREPALTALALAGQQQRFRRPDAGPAADRIPDAARRMHQDPRPILPEGARHTLMRFARSVERGAAGAVLPAAVRRITRSGFRLHPFDLPAIVPHIRTIADDLGLAERAYLILADRPDGAEAMSLLHVEIDAENWTGFPKSHRVAFVARQRQKDPAAARAMVEQAFAAENADMRGRLLEALAAGLGPDDVAFLERAAADRAESVRGIAARLTGRVRGTPAFVARLAEAARCFERSTGGLRKLLKRAGLVQSAEVVFRPPQTANDRIALHASFAGLTCQDVASAAGLSVEQMLDALPADDDAVLAALMETARADGDAETTAQLVCHKLALAHAAGSYPLPFELASLANQLSAPLADERAAELLDSPGWQAALDKLEAATRDDGTLMWTALMLPDGMMRRFLDAIAPLPAPTVRSARDFAELVLQLNTRQPG